MTHSLTLEIPENIYQPLADKAAAEGRKVEDVALEKLANGSERPGEDPFEKFIGAFDSGGMDWANRHDEYLGENLMKEMSGENE